MNLLPVILLLCMICSATCYDSCQQMGEALCFPVSGTYVMTGNIEVYCEFHSNYGYTYIKPTSVGNIPVATFDTLFTEKDEVMLKIWDQNTLQYEARLTQLSQYPNTPLLIMLASNTNPPNPIPSDYVNPGLTTKSLYIGIVAKSVQASSNPNGYAIFGQNYPVTPSSTAEYKSYFSFKNGIMQALSTSTPNRPWYAGKQAATVSIPNNYFYSFCEEVASTSFVDRGLSPGFRFNYVPRCCPEEATVVGTSCAPGRCLNTRCKTCASGFQVRGCDIHNNNGMDFRCCQDNANTYGRCRISPDPHVSRFGRIGNEVQTTGWYLLTEQCGNNKWKIYAKFYRHSPGHWYTLTDRILVIYMQNFVLLTKDYLARTGNINAPVQGTTTTDATNTPVPPTNVGAHMSYSMDPTIHTSYIWIDNGDVEVHLYYDPNGSVTGWVYVWIHLRQRYLDDICGGVCGKWNTIPDQAMINDADFAWSADPKYDMVPVKRAVIEEENISSVKEKRQANNCTFEGTPEAVAWCAERMDEDIEKCPNVDTNTFKEYCQIDHCLGGEFGANMSIGAFLSECYPPKESSCSVCGFRILTTFDGAHYEFPDAECEYVLAKECSNAAANETWEIRMKQKKETLENVDAMMIEKVMIDYHGKDIEFVREPNELKVSGTTITDTSYSDTDNEFIINYHGNMVEFRAIDMVIKYNFRQFLEITMKERWFEKTCGMCGKWNDYKKDDYPEVDFDPPLTDSCNVEPQPGCNSESERLEAKNICLEALEKVNCIDIHPLTQVDRCAEEYCAGKDAYLCEYILGYMDKCHCKNGLEEMLNHEPEACKDEAKKKKQKKKSRPLKLTQDVKIIHH